MTPALALVAAVALGASDPQSYAVDAAQSVIKFHVDHKLHATDGSSRSIEGKAVVQPDGKVLAMVRVPVASFDSGDANRDSNMRETLESSKHPFVVLKGVTSLVMPAALGKPIETKIQGELEFHGVKRPIEVPVTVQFANDGSAIVKGKMTVSLDAYKIDRPSLLMIKLDDDAKIEFELKLRKG
jgi:polyisoprenoid-binding protein YceI